MSTWPGERRTSSADADQPDQAAPIRIRPGRSRMIAQRECHHRERRGGLHGRGEATGQVVGGQEDQREEQPDVAGRPARRPPPPDARGSCRRRASSTRPTGSARTVAAKSGRSGGRSCSVTMYVVPHAAGATMSGRRSASE